jgi:hypothetical protein
VTCWRRRPTNDVIARVMTEVAGDGQPPEAIRAIALGVFDAIDAHPLGGRPALP